MCFGRKFKLRFVSHFCVFLGIVNMRKKRRPPVNKYILQAEYMRITPDERRPPFDEDPSLEALHFAFIHDVILSHIDVCGVPEELQAHGEKKDIVIPRLSCYIVLVTQLAFRKINQLPTAFKNAVWQSIDNFHLNHGALPDVLLLIVTHYVGEALEEVINWGELRNKHVSGLLWNRIKSAYGPEYTAADDEIFDMFDTDDVA